MKNMTHLILGLLLIILGYLILLGVFTNSTNHYTVEVEINSVLSTLTFSTVDNNPLTTDFLKRKFNYTSNDSFIILDIKSISQEEKNKIIENSK
jgi:aminoglycoside N3'-acetyltransferase